MGLSKRARRLEEEELEAARLAREEAERARDELVESAGKLIDRAREDPELQIDEENECVRQLAKKTGRSGDKMQAVRVAGTEKR